MQAISRAMSWDSQFDGRAKGKDYEQAYDREYMFWYNRITKLKKAGAPPE